MFAKSNNFTGSQFFALMKKTLALFAIMIFAGWTYGQDDPEAALYQKANEKLQAGNYKSAILDYSQLINSKFSNKEVFLKRGIANYKTKAYAAAIDDFDAAEKGKVTSPEVTGYRGISYYELKEYDKADKDLAKAIGRGLDQP